jgi:hypothetical protein
MTLPAELTPEGCFGILYFSFLLCLFLWAFHKIKGNR